MNYQGNNPEGYPDPTANQAVGIVSREEKEAAKAKKRAAREYDIRAAMNTERDDREQIEAIRKMMAEKEEKKRARKIRKGLRRKRIHAFLHGKKADKH